VLPQNIKPLRQHVALESSQCNDASHQSSAKQLVLQPEQTLTQGLRATRGNGERDVRGDAADVGRVVVHALEFEPRLSGARGGTSMPASA
jgi:hypothetical protein